ILKRINELEKETTDATRFLPTYDQRQSILQIRALAEELNVKRAELVPKSKFSFKSRKQVREGKNTTDSDNENKNISTIKEISNTATSFDENLQTISYDNRQNTYISMKSHLISEDSRDKVFDIHISNLDHCIVNLVNSAATIGAMHIKGLKDSVVISGPVG
ncbi:9864_t:CDS:2, partial [Acaulospora morrowiae]